MSMGWRHPVLVISEPRGSFLTFGVSSLAERRFGLGSMGTPETSGVGGALLVALGERPDASPSSPFTEPWRIAAVMLMVSPRGALSPGLHG